MNIVRKKLAVFFPGIGYTLDKPLMHYSRRIAADLGYEILLLPYSGFPPKVKGDKERMQESFRIALEQSERMLSGTDLYPYADVLFVGKSIGTAVAAKIASESPCRDWIRLVCYTPLEETFSFEFGDAIVFSGRADPWVGGEKSRIAELASKRDYLCYLIAGANHSLETGNVLQDIRNMAEIMEITEQFMKGNIEELYEGGAFR